MKDIQTITFVFSYTGDVRQLRFQRQDRLPQSQALYHGSSEPERSEPEDGGERGSALTSSRGEGVVRPCALLAGRTQRQMIEAAGGRPGPPPWSSTRSPACPAGHAVHPLVPKSLTRPPSGGSELAASTVRGRQLRAPVRVLQPGRGCHGGTPTGGVLSPWQERGGGRGEEEEGRRERGGQRDRKSTRLNSSH